jgi:hypothetical protein
VGNLAGCIVAARARLRRDPCSIGVMPVLTQLEGGIRPRHSHREPDDPLQHRRSQVARNGVDVEARWRECGRLVMLGEERAVTHHLFGAPGHLDGTVEVDGLVVPRRHVG